MSSSSYRLLMVNKGGKANINLAFIITLPVTTTAKWQVGLFSVQFTINMDASSSMHIFFLFPFLILCHFHSHGYFRSHCPPSSAETSDLMRLKCNMQFAGVASHRTDGYDGTSDIPGPIRELSTSRRGKGGGKKKLRERRGRTARTVRGRVGERGRIHFFSGYFHLSGHGGGAGELKIN